MFNVLYKNSKGSRWELLVMPGHKILWPCSWSCTKIQWVTGGNFLYFPKGTSMPCAIWVWVWTGRPIWVVVWKYFLIQICWQFLPIRASVTILESGLVFAKMGRRDAIAFCNQCVECRLYREAMFFPKKLRSTMWILFTTTRLYNG